MPKNVHVHLHDTAPTRDSDEEGRWVTIHGTHVMVGKGGKIEKGPAALVGKSENEAHSEHHAAKAEEHKAAAKEKGDAHPDSKAHKKAAAAHSMASKLFRSAHDSTERGDLRNAAFDHKGAMHQARQAEGHERDLAERAAGQEQQKFEKPKTHMALHSEAEDDVKGSEKHEAEHKRLMGLYDGSKQGWERDAANRLIQKNATEAVQHKAQKLHHEALAASEHAKRTNDPNDHARALEAAHKAIDAHGKAGGVGYAAKQAELGKMAKEHDRAVGKANKEPKKPNLTPRQAALRESGSPRYAGRRADASGLDAIAERVAKKTAQGAADQDPKHKD